MAAYFPHFHHPAKDAVLAMPTVSIFGHKFGLLSIKYILSSKDYMFPNGLIEIISKVSPMLGAALGGPVGGFVGSLISSKLGGVNMADTAHVAQVLENSVAVEKLKELELQLTDLQNARLQSDKDTGTQKAIRLILVIFAMLALLADIYAIQYVDDSMLQELLRVMFVFLIWDIRQIYKFYFGSSEDLPNFSFRKKNN